VQTGPSEKGGLLFIFRSFWFLNHYKVWPKARSMLEVAAANAVAVIIETIVDSEGPNIANGRS
jgi:hypothetical protein